MGNGINIALAGNPNSGKTTLFNALTGSYQHVGNWPGVTVEKKEGRLKGNKDVLVADLPGIYSLSPYTLEEVITRDHLLSASPDVIINIVDASNLERNLYLTTQLLEMGIPVVTALNMMDVVKKRGDSINAPLLSEKLGCPVVEITARSGAGVDKLIKAALTAAKGKAPRPLSFDGAEETLLSISELIAPLVPAERLRWYTIKLFERDEKATLPLAADAGAMLEQLTAKTETALDDDSESIITNGRYDNISAIIKKCYKKQRTAGLSLSDKIDRVVTNKWAALPIFFGIMWIVYYISITTVGDLCIGYVEEFFGWLGEGAAAGLASAGAADWAQSLVVDGIIGSIGTIFTFVPQLMILFLFLSILEDSGYMARVAFIMDRIFRKFGLSGKSFIPMLIGTGCSIPGIMASRTIENERDRRMTIMLTPFIPCGAKLPVFAMFAAMMFPQQSWVGPSMYLIGIACVIVSGILLKRTKGFRGDPAPFVMELPEYKAPRAKGVLIHMWEKGRSFIIKAGTIIFVACAAIWFLQSFSPTLQYLGPDGIDGSILAYIGNGIKWIFVPLGFGDTWAAPVAAVTGLLAKEAVVSTFASIGTAMPVVFTQVTAYAFMVFTLLSAPCFAAIGAMRREFGNMKWTLIAILYQTGLAYVLAMLINLIGGAALAGTAATTVQALDYGAMEAASEGSVVEGDITLIIFGVILAAAVVFIIASSIYRRKRSALPNGSRA